MSIQKVFSHFPPQWKNAPKIEKIPRGMHDTPRSKTSGKRYKHRQLKDTRGFRTYANELNVFDADSGFVGKVVFNW